MTNPIEIADRQQRIYWKRFLLTFFIFLGLMGVRAVFYYGFGKYELNSKPIGIVVLIITVFVLIIQLFFLIKLIQLKNRINADPQLKEAILEDEIENLNAIKSWRPAFLAAIATPFVFLMISTFLPFNDLLVVALSTIIIGSITYLTSYYLKSRA